VPHLQPQRLVLLALGDELATDVDRDHLSGCALCSASLDDLIETAEAGRATRSVRDLPPPPERVWSAIVADTGVGSSIADDGRADGLHPRRDGKDSADVPSRRRSQGASRQHAGLLSLIRGTLGPRS
jgi:hypothetical protein